MEDERELRIARVLCKVMNPTLSNEAVKDLTDNDVNIIYRRQAKALLQANGLVIHTHERSL